MKTRLTDWLDRARDLEAAIESRVEGVSRRLAASPRQPLETMHAIVQTVAQEVQAVGRGRQTFPYTQLRVWLAAASARERARLSAACEGPPTLQDRIVERLRAEGCAVPLLPLKVSFVPVPKADWLDPAFHVEYGRSTPAPAEAADRSRLDLAVTHGTAERSSYAFTGTTVAIGRGREVRDRAGRLIRTNHVAFLEKTDDVSQTVSRQHARIEYEAGADAFRLHDDGAAHGTSVIRDGRGLPVPRGRGLRLKSGDVIVLGEARVRVVIRSARL
jgi:hypothetical protein